MRTTILIALCCLLLPAHGPAAPDGGTVNGRVIVVNGKDTLKAKDVWVYLQPVKKRGKPKFAKQKQTITQQGRKFTPRVRVVPVGSAVGFPNADKEDHNVFTHTEPTFDLGRFGGGQTKDQAFLDPGEYDIFCDLHSEMSAIVKVVESEWIAEVKDDAFSIPNVPAGDYKVIAWMPYGEEVIEKITVTDGATITAPALHLQAPKQSGTKPHKRKDGTSYPQKGYPAKP
jgi:plastocyanin